MEDPWFITMRAPGSIRITPRNAKGWASFASFMLLLLMPLMWVIPYARITIWAPIAHVAFVIVVGNAFYRLVKVRSEVIDITELLRDAQAQKDARKRR